MGPKSFERLPARVASIPLWPFGQDGRCARWARFPSTLGELISLYVLRGSNPSRRCSGMVSRETREQASMCRMKHPPTPAAAPRLLVEAGRCCFARGRRLIPLPLPAPACSRPLQRVPQPSTQTRPWRLFWVLCVAGSRLTVSRGKRGPRTESICRCTAAARSCMRPALTRSWMGRASWPTGNRPRSTRASSSRQPPPVKPDSRPTASNVCPAIWPTRSWCSPSLSSLSAPSNSSIICTPVGVGSCSARLLPGSQAGRCTMLWTWTAAGSYR